MGAYEAGTDSFYMQGCPLPANLSAGLLETKKSRWQERGGPCFLCFCD